MKKLFTITVLASLLIWAACTKETNNADYSSVPVLPETAFKYIPNDAPDWVTNAIAPIPGAVINEETHTFNIKVTDAGATLGRVLFYDKALSLNNAVSCGSCHKQQFAFADPVPFSKGLMPGDTKRNSLHIVNLFATNNLFWDSRAQDLKKMVMMPVKDHIEMGFENIEKLPVKLEQRDYYKQLFKDAFGDEVITTDRIAIALTQFVKSIISYNSRYDQFMAGTGSLTPMELEGKRLFIEKYNCTTCHGDNNFGASYSGGVANIGLDVTFKDRGAGAVDFNAIFNPGIIEDPFVPTGGGLDEFPVFSGFEGAFKIATLRNVALTAPYMHDGRFKTLEEVVEHYSTGIKSTPSLDWRLQEFADGGMNITDFEKAALVAFLKTLTDYSVVREPRFSDPFVVR